MRAKPKDRAREILTARDFDSLEKWILEARAPLRILFSLTYDEDGLIRWRAIEAIGKAARIVAKSDLDKVRNVIRGFMWLMNDESGGIGWHAPEAIAEILVCVPELMDEYAELLPQFLDEESFAQGALAGLKRLAPYNRDLIRDNTESLAPFLRHKEPQMRVLSFLALEAAKTGIRQGDMDKLAGDNEQVELYDFETGEIVKTQIKGLVKKRRR